ncbi:hypothetical protein N7462_008671 [Penicillium macrosclerotiorum]|uniref:uncharacterized protein n=1 Tax=Penicillium macrosclerotiorum TaxID=303699 RepID=UPI00254813BD|nr:uncharacterized protein N7462_008671 [Penicillium macrosclerotiorum]KAJ5675774.1 hypothetical protein N7462_008671 [Penicillium macrosclerotiorum]
MQRRMCHDRMACKKSDEVSQYRVLKLMQKNDLVSLLALVGENHSSIFMTEFGELLAGSRNVSIYAKSQYEASMLRFCLPGAHMFPEEKTLNEIAVMRYIYDHASIPVPFIFQSSAMPWKAPEPFIHMGYIQHRFTLNDALNSPGLTIRDPPILNSQIDDNELRNLYGKMADILLRLSGLPMSRIGSLEQIDDFTWEVNYRPLSLSMNEIVRSGTLPREELPRLETTFDTSSAYFKALTEIHIKHFAHQRNDAIDSEIDCRRKFIARQLFHKLAQDNKLVTPSLKNRSFTLWCDSLCPANVLLDDDQSVVGMLDWEFTYAAPAEFSCSPPWWLLLERPEWWPLGLDSWSETFQCRLKIFLEALIAQEEKAVQEGWLTEEQRLSGPMWQSWESGDFWISYAARENFAFDEIYWTHIDPRFFGPTANPENAWKHRLDMLSEEQKDEMERIVAQKKANMKEKILEWDPDENTIKWQAEFEQKRSSPSQEEEMMADKDEIFIQSYGNLIKLRQSLTQKKFSEHSRMC